MMRPRSFGLPTLLALGVILVAIIACGGDTVPADDATPAVGEAQVRSDPSESGTTSSDSAPAGRESAGETPAATPVAQVQDTSRPSPGEYLEICGLANQTLEDPFEEAFSLEYFAARFGDVIEQFESVQPPEGYADWHSAMLVYLRALQNVLDDATGPGEGASEEEVEEYILRIVSPVGFQHLPKIFEIVNGMDRDAVTAMLEAGCPIDEESLDDTSTEEEGKEPGPEDGDGIDGGATAEFASVSAGAYHSCGVRTDGTVECWGFDGEGQFGPPDGVFVSVSAGAYHSCGVRTDGTIECWGFDGEDQPSPPDGVFVSVSAGDFHTCGVRPDGSVACWGSDKDGQATPPDGEFTSVSAGVRHTCGVRTDGTVECWGNDSLGQATPPDGEFVSVSAGGVHSCGVRSDGTIECWGFDNPVQFTPLGGSFVSISSGTTHACAVLTGGSVGCWGADGSATGKVTPPGGSFASVSAGDSHTCGVRPDGSVECWGSDEFGQATPPGAK